MFFPFVLLLLTCLASSSHSEVSGSSPSMEKHENQQAETSTDYDNRQRRLRRDLNDLKDGNDIFDDNSGMHPLELEVEGIPQPLLMFLQKMCQLQAKPLRMKTPRLGRTIDFDSDDERMRLPFGSGRINKKNVPFKPRLGKRTCLCDNN
ncbi:protein hugin [Episyrphus balteatus]|uniref:protein hugin n=1 Tax=Episyrphus balteatus TaxID=286459 RepID=UPI002484F068|nr:protein hugin [Episyrphus balteatus]